MALRRRDRPRVRRRASLQRIAFRVESRSTQRHTTRLRLSFPEHTPYQVRQDGKAVPLVQTGNWDYPWRAELSMGGPAVAVELVRVEL